MQSIDIRDDVVADLLKASFAARCSKVSPKELYPQRILVLPTERSWSISLPRYNPPYYDSPAVKANNSLIKEGGWADPPDMTAAEMLARSAYGGLASFEGSVVFDPRTQKPLNPYGRMGIAGRGELGRWGPNFAADAIVIRDGEHGLEMLAVKRKDGTWAIPGGFVNPEEVVSNTVLRELEEETGLKLQNGKGAFVYLGYCADPRNTDNAWIETTVTLFRIPKGSKTPPLKPQDQEVSAARWLPLNAHNVENLYASHPYFVRLAMKLVKQEDTKR